MNKSIITILSFIFLAFITLSCDKLTGPYDRNTQAGVSNGRNVLLEEFTGHKCPNCPTASLEAHELQIDYPELILISVHAGTFASVNSSGLFTYDFRSGAGDTLNTYFNVQGYPSGMINRVPLNTIHAVNPSQWTSAIASFQDDDPIASMVLTNTYDTISRTVTATVNTHFLENYLSPLNITIYITEDSIIKPQYNNNAQVGTVPYIEFYTHRHVLRGSFNGVWGSSLTTGAVTYGTNKTSTLSAALKPEWNDKQCYMVALISNLATNEVMQVVEKKIR